ncbi:MAG: response regulator [Salinivirgaceae bacterium]|jgi:signal transduction histidine kinase|nr:response regulator [Salinivirgaceae bacterium]
MDKFSILYVDDEASNLRIFKDSFRRKYNIFTASSAQEGIKILDNHNVDLILSDQRMPEMTGVEFLKHSLQKNPGPNRILITGYTDLDAIENAINEAHIFQYIQKPWRDDQLGDVIERALRIYHLERENGQQKRDLQIAKQKAEESDRLKTEFLQNLSHEIRTPMNGIIGYSDFLEQDDIPIEKQKSYIRIIKESSNQLLGFIDAILEISALSTNQIKVNKGNFSLNQLLSDVFSNFEEQAAAKSIPIRLNNGLSDGKDQIESDKSVLERIINNIADNALKYTDEGFVEIGYVIENDKVRIYVKDTGIGIDTSKHAVVFERFLQENMDNSKKVGGLGLGLAIAQENARLLGGDITLKSEKGKGSVFYITLPFDNNNASDMRDDAHIEKMMKSTYKILVVDDEEINSMLLEKILKTFKNYQFEILKAANGLEALKFFEDGVSIDFVLMDMKMPIMDGHEATKKIKALRPEIPIIAQTAYCRPADKEEALQSGCNELISKPIDRKVINNLLKEYLNENLL